MVHCFEIELCYVYACIAFVNLLILYCNKVFEILNLQTRNWHITYMWLSVMIYGEINLTTDPSTGVPRKLSTWLIPVMYSEISRARIDDSIIVIKPRFHIVSFT